MRQETSVGQGMIEYALIITGVALIAAVGFLAFGQSLASEHDSVFSTAMGFFGG